MQTIQETLSYVICCFYMSINISPLVLWVEWYVHYALLTHYCCTPTYVGCIVLQFVWNLGYIESCNCSVLWRKPISPLHLNVQSNIITPSSELLSSTRSVISLWFFRDETPKYAHHLGDPDIKGLACDVI